MNVGHQQPYIKYTYTYLYIYTEYTLVKLISYKI